MSEKFEQLVNQFAGKEYVFDENTLQLYAENMRKLKHCDWIIEKSLQYLEYSIIPGKSTSDLSFMAINTEYTILEAFGEDSKGYNAFASTTEQRVCDILLSLKLCFTSNKKKNEG